MTRDRVAIWTGYDIVIVPRVGSQQWVDLGTSASLTFVGTMALAVNQDTYLRVQLDAANPQLEVLERPVTAANALNFFGGGSAVGLGLVSPTDSTLLVTDGELLREFTPTVLKPTMAAQRLFSLGTQGLTLSPDGRWLVVPGTTDSELYDLLDPSAQPRPIGLTTFSPDGRYLIEPTGVFATTDYFKGQIKPVSAPIPANSPYFVSGNVLVVEKDSGCWLQTFDLAPLMQLNASAPCQDILVSPDASWFVANGRKGQTGLWLSRRSGNTWLDPISLLGSNGAVGGEFFPDSSQFLAIVNDQVKVWRTSAPNTPIGTPPTFSERFANAAFGPGPDFITAVTVSGDLLIWQPFNASAPLTRIPAVDTPSPNLPPLPPLPSLPGFAPLNAVQLVGSLVRPFVGRMRDGTLVLQKDSTLLWLSLVHGKPKLSGVPLDYADALLGVSDNGVQVVTSPDGRMIVNRIVTPGAKGVSGQNSKVPDLSALIATWNQKLDAVLTPDGKEQTLRKSRPIR